MRSFLSFVVFSFLCLWGSGASYLEAQEPKAFELGPRGFVFIPVTRGNLEPELANDGSPLYEGEKLENGKLIRTNLSLKHLKELRDQEILFEKSLKTDWMLNVANIQISTQMIENGIRHLSQRPKDFHHALGGLNFEKAEFIRRLLFGKNIVLRSGEYQKERLKELDDQIASSSVDSDERKRLLEERAREKDETTRALSLVSLQRSASQPEPDRVKIPFRISELPFLIDVSSEWLVEVLLDELRFDFESKQIEFDPLTNVIRLHFNCSGAVLRGPVREVGRFKELHRYGGKDKHWWGTYHDTPNYLAEGLVGPVTLTIEMQLFRDLDGYWRIALVQSEAQPGIRLKPREQDPKVKMHYRNLVKSQEGEGDTLDQSFKLSAGILEVINGTLSKMLVSAFGSALLDDDLGRTWPLKNNFELKVKPESRIQFRLSDFRILNTGLMASFDARAVGIQSADPACLGEDPASAFHKSALQRIDFEPAPGKTAWSLELNLADTNPQWKVDEKSDPSLYVHVSSKALELQHLALWNAGFYCPHTKWLWPRSGAWPPLSLTQRRMPKLSWRADGLDLDFEIHADLFERNLDSEVVWQRALNLDFQLPLHLNWDAQNKVVSLSGIESFKLHASTDQDQAMLQHLLEFSANEITNYPLQKINQLLADFESAFAIKNVSWGESKISIELSPLDSGEQMEGAQSRPSVADRSVLKPETKILTGADSSMDSGLVEILWSSNVPEAFFSWRFRNVAEREFSAWTSFEPEKKAMFSVSSTGRFEFQVLAMNSFFVTEDYPKSLFFSVNAKIQSSDDSGQRTEVWAVPALQEKKTQVEKTSTTKPLSDPGFFGCSLSLGVNRNSDPAFSFPGLLWISLCFLFGLACFVHRSNV